VTLSFSAGGQIIAAHGEMISRPREFSEAKSAFSECVCVSLKSVCFAMRRTCGVFHSVRSIYLPRGGDRRKADAGFLPAFTCILSPVTLKFNTYGERVCASGILLRQPHTRDILLHCILFYLRE
jgi:hypothetical protein